MRWLRAFAVWLLIAAAETLHGIARTLWLVPMSATTQHGRSAWSPAAC